MHDYQEEDDELGTARGIMNAVAMALIIWAAVAVLASCVVGWT